MLTDGDPGMSTSQASDSSPRRGDSRLISLFGRWGRVLVALAAGWALLGGLDDVRRVWLSDRPLDRQVAETILNLAWPVALLVALRWPWITLGIYAGAIVIGVEAHYYIPAFLCGVIALAASLLRGRRSLVIVALGETLALLVCLVVFTETPFSFILWMYLPFFAVVALGLWLIGALYRRHHEAVTHTEQLERDVRALRAHERHQLARELHDVVSRELVAVQPHARLLREAADGAERERQLSAIQEAARRAQDGLDSLVLVLESEDAIARSALTSAAVPVHESLARCAERLEDLGHHVTTTLTTQVPPHHAATVDRILGEATANIVAHGGGASACTFVVRREADSLLIDVTNELTGTGPTRTASLGTGTAGLSERATALGGRLTSRAEGSLWRLHAELPLPPDAEASEQA